MSGRGMEMNMTRRDFSRSSGKRLAARLLALDNLLEANLVLANGRFMTASAVENPDLFWAVRGGGGNFGIVTSFVFRGCPVDQVFAGPMLWDMEHARELLEWYREATPKQPEELSGIFAFLKVPRSSGLIAAHWIQLKRHFVRSGSSERRGLSLWDRCRTRLFKACSTPSIHPACSGIGGATSLPKFQIERSTNT
jgi:hypothetical protein